MLCLVCFQAMAQKTDTYCEDADGDTYGNPNNCQVGGIPPFGWVQNNFDCDDTDPNITTRTLWYPDVDGDGFGKGPGAIQACTQPAGYSATNDDACPNEYGTINGCPAPLTNHSFGNYNYIYEEILQVAALEGMYNNVSDNQKIRNITFFDGLGREVQSRAIGASPLGKDIVSHIEYDNLGRISKSYLPYTSDYNNGNFELGALTETLDHYDDPKYDNTTNPYTEQRFEESPLNRLLETGAPGASWAVNATSDSDHTVKMGYAVNSATDNLHKVRYYEVTLSSDYTPTLTTHTSTYYPLASLYKTIVKDENWTPTSGKLHTSETFSNKFGQTILKRTYADISGTVTPHDTYYVYDIYNNLAFVIPPKVDTSDGVSTIELAELCYQYKYDKYNRLVEKKLAGKGWEYIIYDKLDRPIMTQDAVQRAKTNKEWLFTKFDVYGRVVYTGIYTDNRTRAQIQTEAQSSSITYEQKIPGSPFPTIFDYTNAAYPTGITDTDPVGITESDIYIVNYYDDYNFNTSGLNVPTAVYGVNTISDLNSLPTGTLERVFDANNNVTNDWITSIRGYDDKARVIYTATKNDYLDITTTSQIKLDFTGKVEESDTHHTKNSTVSVVDKFSYDHQGRLLTQKQQINLQEEELIVKNNYDELGRLENKKVGNTEANPLQSIDYKYNVRGWLTDINDIDNVGTDLFSFRIGYDQLEISGGTALYNGNIAETLWSTKNDQDNMGMYSRGYSYEYDALSRITAANYKVKTTSAGNYTALNTAEYNVYGVNYDKNGNIKGLNRNADHGSNSIDYLTYSYDENDVSNRLMRVTDNAGSTYKDEGFQDGINTGDDYDYDENGNLIKDENKGITDIDYNHLNLPIKVYFGSTKRIEYIYTSSGVKLEKKVINSSTTTTQYSGSFIYENGILRHFSHGEGYVEYALGSFIYIYQYTDHLGNVRLNYTNNGSRTSPFLQVKEENNYYPFGMKHEGYNSAIVGIQNDYKYNGKELQDEEISGKKLQWYDYNARNYDPSIGKFFNIDPLADEPTQIDKSPYAYVWNNPVKMIDPTGMQAEMEEPNISDDQRNSNLRRHREALGYTNYGAGASIMGYFGNGTSGIVGSPEINNNHPGETNASTQDDREYNESSIAAESGYWTLTKETFLRVLATIGITNEKTAGRLFEAIVHEYMVTSLLDYSYEPNSRTLGRASPDGIASPTIIKSDLRRGIKISMAFLSSLYEVKLKKEGTYISSGTNRDQGKRFMDYLDSLDEEIKSITYVTSHRVYIDRRYIQEAKKRDITVRLMWAQYRWNDNLKVYEIKFYHTSGFNRAYDAVSGSGSPVKVSADLLIKYAPFLKN